MRKLGQVAEHMRSSIRDKPSKYASVLHSSASNRPVRISSTKYQDGISKLFGNNSVGSGMRSYRDFRLVVQPMRARRSSTRRYTTPCCIREFSRNTATTTAPLTTPFMLERVTPPTQSGTHFARRTAY